MLNNVKGKIQEKPDVLKWISTAVFGLVGALVGGIIAKKLPSYDELAAEAEEEIPELVV